MSLRVLRGEIESCRRCPRLVEYRAEISVQKRRAYLDQEYWAKPVAGFGDPLARLWIIGLAPGAHGANRTGRVFTGDRSGDFLFAALHRVGMANQAQSFSVMDGLRLTDCFISAAARCAPPDNKPLPGELMNCQPFLDREFRLLRRKRVILALGGIAWTAAWLLLGRQGLAAEIKTIPFGHGAVLEIKGGLTLIGSYHVSQQNTFTGRLTKEMFEAVLRECARRF